MFLFIYFSLDILHSVASIYKDDGLSNLRYHTVQKEEKPLYKWILVRINQTDIEQVSNQPKHVLFWFRYVTFRS